MNTERQRFPGMDLRGSVAIVTGAGSGIGRETALSLADLGADVAVLDVDGPAAARTSAEITAIGRRALAQQVDV
ncbi:MAG: SDR family NAD(P)-dependent oxidoreductase [Chloroflexi bacterium]|nr:SDR family NAD(P)-dependent oxidoreductase [Chloroflexota bacterium]